MSFGALPPPRAGEELPHEPLAAFLEQVTGERAAPEVRQFPGGYSNLTYRVRYGKHDLVLRRPPRGVAIKSAHDMGREYRILRALHPVWPKAPRPVAACDDESVLGAPFYLMDFVDGVILRSRPPEGIELRGPSMERVSRAAAATLAEIHSLDYAAAGLASLGRPEGYARRQIEGWRKRWENSRLADSAPEMEHLGEWLDAQPLAPVAPALIHNDFKYDNLIFDGGLQQVVACLDWEMATIGDPLLDLGTSLAYWIDPGDPEEWQAQRFCLTTLPGNLNRLGFAQQYADARGIELPPLVMPYAYGLYKIAVIVQQIYARFRAGHSTDPRFAALAPLPGIAARMALCAIHAGRIHRLG